MPTPIKNLKKGAQADELELADVGAEEDDNKENQESSEQTEPNTIAFEPEPQKTTSDFLKILEDVYGKGKVTASGKSYRVGEGDQKVTYDFKQEPGSITIPANPSITQCEDILKVAKALGRTLNFDVPGTVLTDQQKATFRKAAELSSEYKNLIKEIASKQQAQQDGQKAPSSEQQPAMDSKALEALQRQMQQQSGANAQPSTPPRTAPAQQPQRSGAPMPVFAH